MKNILFYFKKDLANHTKAIKVNGDFVDFQKGASKLVVDVPLFRINNEIEVEALSGYVFKEKFSFLNINTKKVEIAPNPLYVAFVWRLVFYIICLSITVSFVFFAESNFLKIFFGFLSLVYLFTTFPIRDGGTPFVVKVLRR